MHVVCARDPQHLQDQEADRCSARDREWCLKGHHNLCPNVEFIGAPPFDGAMTNQIWVPHRRTAALALGAKEVFPTGLARSTAWIATKSQIVALPETMDALEAAMLEPLGDRCVHQ
jgi:L-iditol 2-dehydrogenase